MIEGMGRMRTSGKGQGGQAQTRAGRVKTRVTTLLCWWVVIMWVAGCPSLPPLPPPAPPAVPEVVPPSGQGPSAEYPLGPGDVLRITIYGHGDLPQEVVLAADGSFAYPFIGQVQAAGLTVPQLTAAMARRVQTLKRNTTLLELIAAAGGPTPEAGAEVIIARATPPEETGSPGQSQSRTAAVRVNLEKLLAGEVAQRLEIERGDTVYIPKGEIFFISGEVQKPGRYPLERDTTVAKALILAGGPSKFAAPKRATVQRVVEGQRREYHAVQADDILVVPQSIF